ncbi:hypothetical protein LWM68_33685 [Niabella sp. W65]|nr:hypothetical protein [Niabella sp. W65]MCH7367278.1 hypothetical protein [Niabella sp. W65]
MAFITTDAFLNSPSNHTAREYLFQRADFVGLAVMPDNLMKDTGNTEAPNHLLIVQKNTGKEKISWEEDWLNEVRERENEFGRFPIIILSPLTITMWSWAMCVSQAKTNTAELQKWFGRMVTSTRSGKAFMPV